MSIFEPIPPRAFYRMPKYDDIVRMEEGRTFIGILDNIVRSDDDYFVYVCMLDKVIKVPSELAAKLNKMIDQKIVLARINGEYRVALSSL